MRITNDLYWLRNIWHITGLIWTYSFKTILKTMTEYNLKERIKNFLLWQKSKVLLLNTWNCKLGGIFAGWNFRWVEFSLGGIFVGGIFLGGIFVGGIFLGGIFVGGIFGSRFIQKTAHREEQALDSDGLKAIKTAIYWKVFKKWTIKHLFWAEGKFAAVDMLFKHFIERQKRAELLGTTGMETQFTQVIFPVATNAEEKKLHFFR